MKDKLFYQDDGSVSNLTHLSITNCDLGVLKPDVFLGLENLHTLTLDYCEITDIKNSFEHLVNLKKLSLAFCEGDKKCGHINQNFNRNLHHFFTGLSHLPVYKLRGPTSLQVLDVTNVLVFPEGFEESASGEESGPSLLGGGNGTQFLPLEDLKYLNLTGALLNMDNPMEHLDFGFMPSLEVSCTNLFFVNYDLHNLT